MFLILNGHTKSVLKSFATKIFLINKVKKPTTGCEFIYVSKILDLENSYILAATKIREASSWSILRLRIFITILLPTSEIQIYRLFW